MRTGSPLGLMFTGCAFSALRGDTFSRNASVRGLGASESPPAGGATTACARAGARKARRAGAAAPLRAPDALSARGVVTRAESADADMVKAAIAIEIGSEAQGADVSSNARERG